MLGGDPDVVADDVEQVADVDLRLLDVVRDRDCKRAVDAFAVERGRLTDALWEPRGGRNFLTQLMPCNRSFFHELVRVPV
jgi:hypothetical protein